MNNTKMDKYQIWAAIVLIVQVGLIGFSAHEISAGRWEGPHTAMIAANLFFGGVNVHTLISK